MIRRPPRPTRTDTLLPDTTLFRAGLAAMPGEFLIGFSDMGEDVNLSPSGDLVEAAARLFELLHIAEDSGRDAIAIAPVPDTGLGRAINDRLRRAAAERPLRPS